MTFAGIDVNIITHERAEAAGPEAFGLWCWGMCWAQIHASDGRVPRIVALRALGGRRNMMLAKRLEAVGLWLPNDDGSWTIRNYAGKNQTSEEIAARKEAAKLRKDAWKSRQAEKRNANGTRSGTLAEHVPERSIQDQTIQDQTRPIHELERSAAPSTPPKPVVTLPTPKRRPETSCPASDATPDVVGEWAASWSIPVTHGEFAGFIDHHRKSDKRFRDWSAAWRTWLRNSSKFGARLPFANAIVQSGDNRAWKIPEGF